MKICLRYALHLLLIEIVLNDNPQASSISTSESESQLSSQISISQSITQSDTPQSDLQKNVKIQLNNGTTVTTMRLDFIGENVINYIDDMSINASSYLTNENIKYSSWNITDFLSESKDNVVGIGASIVLMTDSVLFDIDDFRIWINGDSAQEQNLVYYNINVHESVLPSSRYTRYNSTSSDSSAEVSCSFGGGGITYNLISIKEEGNLISNVQTEGSIIIGLQNGQIVIDSPDSTISNYIKLGQYLKNTGQEDFFAVDSFVFEDIFLSCPPAYVLNNVSGDNIKCLLVGKINASNQVFIWDLNYAELFVFITHQFKFEIIGNYDSNFIVNLKNLQFYGSNKIIIGVKNYGVVVYTYYIKGTAQATKPKDLNCKSTYDFTVYKLSSETHDIYLDSCFIIELFNDMALLDSALYVVSSNVGLSAIDLSINKYYHGIIAHPSFVRLNINVNANLYESSRIIFIGIEIDNNPDIGITEFFVEALVKQDLFFTPTINKIFVSKEMIVYNGIQTGPMGLLILLDTLASRLLIIQRSIPNTLNMPTFQIKLNPDDFDNLSQAHPILLPGSDSNIFILIKGKNSKSLLLSNLSANSFEYDCSFNKENDYIMNLDLYSLCKDLITTCHQVSNNELKVQSSSSDSSFIIITIIFIILIIIIIVLIVLCRKGYFKKISKDIDSNKYEKPSMDSQGNKEDVKTDTHQHKFDVTD